MTERVSEAPCGPLSFGDGTQSLHPASVSPFTPAADGISRSV